MLALALKVKFSTDLNLFSRVEDLLQHNAKKLHRAVTERKQNHTGVNGKQLTHKLVSQRFKK